MDYKNIKFYYINLEGSNTRRDNMEHMLTNLGLNYERFPAVKIADHENLTYTTRTLGNVSPENVTNGKQPNFGAFGCLLSHLTIIEQNYDNPQPYVILEDDIDKNQFTHEWLRQFQHSVNTLIQDKEVSMVRPLTNGTATKNAKIHCISDKDHFVYTKKGYTYPEDIILKNTYMKNYVRCPIILDPKTKFTVGMGTPCCYINNSRQVLNDILDYLGKNKINFLPIDRIYTGHVQNSYIYNGQVIWRDYVESDIKEVNKNK